MDWRRIAVVIVLVVIAIWAVQSVVGCDIGESSARASDIPRDEYSVRGEASDLLGDVLDPPSLVAKRKRCGVARMSRWHYGITGRLFTVTLHVWRCVEGGRIVTIKPHTETTINTAGSIGQWSKDGQSKFQHWFRWGRRDHGGFAMTRKVHFHRQLCVLGNCVTVGSSEIAVHIRLHDDFSYWRG